MPSPARTHYDVLGIARDADAAAVRAAWKLHVQAWHPDRFSGAMREEAERQAVLINEAYSTLRDQSRRAAYDCRLAAEETPRVEARPARPAPQPFATAHRAAAARVGSPMAAPVPPARSMRQHAWGALDEALLLARRHPRVLAAAALAWVTVIGASAAMHVASAPALPGDAPALRGTPASAADPVAQEQAAGLEELAKQAKAEADKADAELARLIAQDEAAARAEAAAARAADARAAREAARAARASRSRRAAPRPSRAPAATGRVVRVMPAAAATV